MNTEPLLHSRRPRPGLAGQPIDKDHEHPAKRLRRRFLRQRLNLCGRQQGAHVEQEAPIGQLREHPLLGLRLRDGLAGKRQVPPEHLDDTVVIEALEDLECVRKVVEIAPLVALQQRAQLGRQHFLAGECRNGRLTGEPGVHDLQRQCRRRVECFDLAGIDLDFQSDWHAAAILGLNSETKLRRDGALLELRPPKPWIQSNSQLIKDRTDRTV